MKVSFNIVAHRCLGSVAGSVPRPLTPVGFGIGAIYSKPFISSGGPAGYLNVT